ncbi:hypothetical protein [Paracoccus aminophilus]|uniref:hypothetical protein n=1 Tax=Paracoccus aminophilus TaxID=34003 RepID=UPI00041C7719|nr:hypothetical protein [Paracoccus aminophilus]
MERIAIHVGIDTSRLQHPVDQLSGGNRHKAFFGKCLERDDIRGLLRDEPTRGVDVGGRAEIHCLLRALVVRGASPLPILMQFRALLTT